jgi:hypothetical protein
MAWVSKWCAKCGVCGHEWLPKDPEKYGDPKQCAKCKSWRWNDGNDERGAKSGVPEDHGEVGAAGRARARNLRPANEKPEAVHSAKRRDGGADLRGVWAEISGSGGSGSAVGDDGVGSVRRPRDGSQPESGAVGNGPRPDSGSEGAVEKYVSVVDRPYIPPPHLKDCKCKKCVPPPKKMCPIHGTEFQNFGSKWVCTGPPLHSELK